MQTFDPQKFDLRIDFGMANMVKQVPA